MSLPPSPSNWSVPRLRTRTSQGGLARRVPADSSRRTVDWDRSTAPSLPLLGGTLAPCRRRCATVYVPERAGLVASLVGTFGVGSRSPRPTPGTLPTGRRKSSRYGSWARSCPGRLRPPIRARAGDGGPAAGCTGARACGIRRVTRRARRRPAIGRQPGLPSEVVVYLVGCPGLDLAGQPASGLWRREYRRRWPGGHRRAQRPSSASSKNATTRRS
jgi:hypothetical protein